MKKALSIVLLCVAAIVSLAVPTQGAPKFKVIAFYTGRDDLAHISFVHEANRWFPEMARKSRAENPADIPPVPAREAKVAQT